VHLVRVAARPKAPRPAKVVVLETRRKRRVEKDWPRPRPAA
jgi:hypothetical protein